MAKSNRNQINILAKEWREAAEALSTNPDPDKLRKCSEAAAKAAIDLGARIPLRTGCKAFNLLQIERFIASRGEMTNGARYAFIRNVFNATLDGGAMPIVDQLLVVVNSLQKNKHFQLPEPVRSQMNELVQRALNRPSGIGPISG